MPAGVAGLKFRNEAETVNQLVPQLRQQGIEAIVVLIHEGGLPTGGYNECPAISGPIVDIVKKLDKAVDVVISGHTHRAYNCRIDGRLVTSADKYGTVVSAIDLVLDPKTRDITSASADNVIARTSLCEGAAADSADRAIRQARRAVGQTRGRPHRRRADRAMPARAGESPLGQVIADAQLAATQWPEDGGAQIALMNPGGIRAALAQPTDGQVRYEDLFSVQPFYNNLVTLTLSGAQLLELLEQQWKGQAPDGRVLSVSRGFSYSWDASKPVGQRIVPGSVRLDGRADRAGGHAARDGQFLPRQRRGQLRRLQAGAATPAPA